MIIEIKNLKISNQSLDQLVTITDQYPVLNWEYQLINRVELSNNFGEINSIYQNDPWGYEIKVGRFSYQLGEDDFEGDIEDSGFVSGDDLHWRYRGPELERGNTYYGQIRITDSEGNSSEWKTFSFSYNALPAIVSTTITPSSPTIHDDLLLSYEFYDALGESESGSEIWWYINGVHDSQFNNLVSIKSKYLVFGDIWAAQIFPKDGKEFGKPVTTSTVTITATTPTVNNAKILPSQATSKDPLFASYEYASSEAKPDQSIIKWYVNDVLQSESAKLARFQLNTGDLVKYEIKPSDGDLSGDWVASEEITIVEPTFKVNSLKINGISEDFSSSLNPVLTWRHSGPDRAYTKLKVDIGTAPGSNNVYSNTIASSDSIYSIPDNILFPGRDYYATVYIGEESFGESATVHFRTSGSLWDNVDNTIGWTLEFTALVNAPDVPCDVSSSGSSSSSSSTCPSELYHGVAISDGTNNATIAIYADHIELISASTISYDVDTSEYATYTVTGIGSNIKVYRNYKLILNGTGLFTSNSDEKYIEFGAIGPTGEIYSSFINIDYNISGAYEPSNSAYFDMEFINFHVASGQVDWVSGEHADIYYSVSDERNNINSTVYKINSSQNSKSITPSSIEENNLQINKIYTSPNGNYTYFCHNNGVTVFKGRPRDKFISNYDFTNTEIPYDWKLFNLGNGYETWNESLSITTTQGGKFYYSQREHGSKWFDNISNDNGWTVEFGLDVLSITDSNMAYQLDAEDAIGVYINDGKYKEVIWFYTDSIWLQYANVNISYDTSSAEYVICGKGKQLKLFAKTADTEYALLANVKLEGKGTEEGNGSRPSVCEDSDGIVHAVWHDDGSSNRSIYYSRGEDSEYGFSWSVPEKITKTKYDCINPNIFCENNHVYIVFEQIKNDKSDIGMIVKNDYGTSEPFDIDSGPFQSEMPKIISQNGTLHVVWQDRRYHYSSILYKTRNSSGQWSDIVKLSNSGFDSIEPSIDIYNGTVYVSYTQINTDGKSNVFVTKYDGTLNTPIQVSSNGLSADFSDLIVKDSVVYIVWHDSKDDNYEIFARKMSTSLGYLTSAEKITNNQSASRFPKIGYRQGSDDNTGNLYVVFESGGDISPYDPTGFESTYTYLSALVYSHSFGDWLSSNSTVTIGMNEYGGYDSQFSTDDYRQSRRPAISKRFAGDAHIIYETEIGTADDEYLEHKLLFTNIYDAQWNLNYENIVSLADSSIDLKISAYLNRKEIRFGDFSNFYGSELDFTYFNIINEYVEPFNARLIKQGTKAYSAIVNDYGDAWVGLDSSFGFYDYKNNIYSEIDNINVYKIEFDANNIMYILSDGKVLASFDHINFYEVFSFISDVVSFALSGEFAWVATASSLYKIKTLKFIENLPRNDGSFTAYSGTSGIDYLLFTEDNGLLGEITCIAADSSNNAYVGTKNGISWIRENIVSNFTSENTNIGDGTVFDISIVNTAIRYIATTSGLFRMVGGNIEGISFQDENWSDYIKSVGHWTSNDAWASGGGKIFIVRRDPISGNYSYTFVGAEEYADFSLNESCVSYKRYSFNQTLENKYVEVSVNDRKISYGYEIHDNTIVFETNLLPSDKVSVVIRNDIEEYATLVPNQAEKLVYGMVNKKLDKFVLVNNSIFGSVSGDTNQIVKYDINLDNKLPYDTIVLDSTPPVGELTFVEQIDSHTVKLKIENYSDNLSGIKEMIVSNYANLTSDGSTPLEWQPFNNEITFDLGNDFGNIYTQLSLDADGSCLSTFGSDVYASTDNPSNIYKYNSSSKSWVLQSTIDSSSSVKFLIEYKNALYAGLSNGTSGSLWETSNGTSWNKRIDYSGVPYCADILNDKLYIGASGGSGGQLFSFDGTNSARVANGIGNAIYSITATPTVLYLGTGEGGLIYRYVDKTQRTTLAAHDKDSQITAMGWSNVLPANPNSLTPDPDVYVFAGTGSSGRIVKSVNSAPFTLSFSSLASKVSKMKQDSDGILHAAVGKNIYKYKNHAWVIVYSNNEVINDFNFDQTGFHLISNSEIKRINQNKGTKTLYLSLKDVAGNASREPGSEVSSGESIITDIDINDLVGFVHTNKLLEIDEYGNVIWTYGDGSDESFYSGDRVNVEYAEYYSEIFNGGGDHVTWDVIYWDAVVPADTDLTISVRTAENRSDLLTASWSKVFQKEDFLGGDISNLGGQFLQFKVTMSTSIRGKSPKLYKINIRSRARTSVHFFTTNFVLPSVVKGGILTANTFVPLAADIIFAINTNDSTDFSDYTIIEKDRLFKLDGVQGTNVRIGVKLISPLGVNVLTDIVDEYDSYLHPTWTNIIPFSYTATADKTIFFKIELFDNYELSGDHVCTVYSGTSYNAFAVDSSILTDTDGYAVSNGQTIDVIAAIKGNAAIRCNEFYYAKVSVYDGSVSETVDDSHVFIANCYSNYVNSVDFDFINDTGSTNDFGFRIMVYSDATRTKHVKTYSSNNDSSGWTVDGGIILESGVTLTSGETISVSFTPEVGDLELGNYYLVISYYVDGEFVEITTSPMLTINTENLEYCGEYTNVPIFKDLAIMLELEEYTEKFGSSTKIKKTFNFNL